MALSVSSTIIIDLLLLTDAVADGSADDVRRLARVIRQSAISGGFTVIAEHAQHVSRIASTDRPFHGLAEAVCKLLAESERAIHHGNLAQEAQRAAQAHAQRS